MNFTDSHCHIQFPGYDSDRDEVLRRAREAGVKMLLVGTQFSSSEAGIRLATALPGECWASVGFHPNHVAGEWYHDKKEQQDAEQEHFDEERLSRLVADNAVVAVGECGLDYYRLPTDISSQEAIKKAQQEVLKSHIKIAKQYHKPLMIHCRPSQRTDDAYEDLYRIIMEYEYAECTVIHFYVGSPAMTKKFVDAGFNFTFGGVVTFSSDYDESLGIVPPSQLLIETDCPYVAPASKRGTRNEPSFIPETYQVIADKKKISLSELQKAVADNFQRIFSITFVL